MNLMDLARGDNQTILNDAVSGFSKEITLINLSAVSQLINAFNIRVTQELDPETGILMVSKKSALNVYLSDITIGAPIKGWKVTFTDFEGSPIGGTVIRVEPERTFGYVSLIIGV